MNELINNLRLDAGISQLKDDPRLVVIDSEGNVIDPLIGLEKFAELIVRECVKTVARQELMSHPEHNWEDKQIGYNEGIRVATKKIKEHFGIE